MSFARVRSCGSLFRSLWIPANNGNAKKFSVKLKSTNNGNARETEDKSHVYATSDFQNHMGMQLVFLGTSSSVPTTTRNNSCVALRLEGTVYLFDCGEGAQKQFFRTPMRQRGVDKIFITHMHGDHIFGLPGLMAGIALTASGEKKPMEIYGPQGLRNWLRVSLNVSHTRVPTKYAVHELMLEKDKSTKSSTKAERNKLQHLDELPGRDIYCSEGGLWDVFSDEKYRMRAGLLKHTIPCWGYVFEENPRIGRFMVECAERIGIEPGEQRDLLQRGQSVFVNGREVFPSDVLGPPRRGRKVAILGDTYKSRSLQSAAFGADTLVHECTLLEEDAIEAVKKGHSTATMAGKFARSINAHSLILTHFGGKLNRPGQLEKSVNCAKKAFGKDMVFAARDLLSVTIKPTNDIVDQI